MTEDTVNTQKIVGNMEFAGLSPKVWSREVFKDKRGSFSMLFQYSKIREVTNTSLNFIQTNLIVSEPYSLRGWHFSPIEDNHWKIVTCIVGQVREAVLDVRPSSGTFGYASFVDFDATGSVLLIPPGFAHAVQTLSSPSEIVYATTVAYEFSREISINPINQMWPIWENLGSVSERDKLSPSFEEWQDRF